VLVSLTCHYGDSLLTHISEEREMDPNLVPFGGIPLILNSTGKVLLKVSDVRPELEPDVIHMDVEGLDAMNEMKDTSADIPPPPTAADCPAKQVRAVKTADIACPPTAVDHLAKQVRSVKTADIAHPPMEVDHPAKRVRAAKESTTYKIVNNNANPDQLSGNILYRMPPDTPEIALVDTYSDYRQAKVLQEQKRIAREDEIYEDEGEFSQGEEFFVPQYRPTLERDGYRYRSSREMNVIHGETLPDAQQGLFYAPATRAPSMRPLALAPSTRQSKLLSARPQLHSTRQSQPPSTRHLQSSSIHHSHPSSAHHSQPSSTRCLQPSSTCQHQLQVLMEERGPRSLARGDIHSRGLPFQVPHTRSHVHGAAVVPHVEFENAVAGPSRLGSEMMTWVPKTQHRSSKHR